MTNKQSPEIRITEPNSQPEYDERIYQPYLGTSGNMVWDLGNDVYVTTTADRPPEPGDLLTIGSPTYVRKKGGDYLRHEDGSYAIQCDAQGNPFQNLMSLKG